VRPLLESILGELLSRHRGTGRVDLNDITEVIGGRAVSYEEVDRLIGELEAAGLRVAEPLSGQDVVVMRSVIVSAHRLRARLSRRPTVDEIASECGHPPHAVRRALEHGRLAARVR
jgi:hypothetical protein